MAEDPRTDSETPAEQPVEVTVSHSKTRASLAKIPPQLSEKEFASSGAQKLLREELERLDREVSESKEKLDSQILKLAASVEKFHLSDKRVTELETEAKASKEAQTLRALCLTIGSVLIGLTTAGWLTWPGQAVVAGVGALLVLGSFVARRSKK